MPALDLDALGAGAACPLGQAAGPARTYFVQGETALDEWRGSGLDRAALLAPLERTLTATVEAMTA